MWAENGIQLRENDKVEKSLVTQYTTEEEIC